MITMLGSCPAGLCGGGSGNGGGRHSTPEFDATAGIAALALLITIGVILYRRVRRAAA